jgi:hypothetical protein
MKKILFLFFMSFCVLPSNAQDSTLKQSIDSLIKKNIEKGLFKGIPVIIVDGYALIDSVKTNKVFSTINVVDIDSINIIKYDKASELFESNARNGVLIITCKKNIKNKIKRIFKD